MPLNADEKRKFYKEYPAQANAYDPDNVAPEINFERTEELKQKKSKLNKNWPKQKNQPKRKKNQSWIQLQKLQ